MPKTMTVQELIDRLKQVPLATPVYFGEYSQAHQRDRYSPVKVVVEPVRYDSQGYVYPPLETLGEEGTPALIIRKDFAL